MTGGSRLPGMPDDEEGDPIVLHVDMDCFYAACERRREPRLEGEPVVVGMGYEGGETHGAVATASYEAREYGVDSAQAISTALERLPRMADAEDPDSDADPDDAGYYRPVDMDYYEAVSSEVKEILHESADVVREVSIDEAYLDVTDRTAWEVAEGFARHVKHRIDREVGVTASVGVAPNMSAAKIASDHDKPDGLVVVEPGEVREFLAPLDVAELHGVGPVTARELREMGVETAADLTDADRAALEDRFGERGAEMHRRARGEDQREVTPTGRPKSLSRESAFTEATDDDERKRDQIRTLAEAVADRARRKGAMYRTIGIKAVTPPYDVNTRAKSLPGPVDDPELVEEVALDLFAEFAGVEVRKVGVRVSNLSFADGEQASLGDGWESSADERDGDAEGDGSDPDTDDGQVSLGRRRDGDSESPDSPESGDGRDDGGDETARDDPDGQLSLAREWEGADGASDQLAVSDREGENSTDDGETSESDDSDPEGQVSLGDFG
ncbi:DNA polymerase IV [Halorussus gelatinilyticus]|uniref:DNA polymerase IV n=1 Tax=Halorussus gelatinilyticus TaxID=2937524 RepID=A0A8U0IG36_9EURY|nr:DNA polymerase IV [Halorussus gelatinilyticus]UPW00050.1 DNA polymerase IV [Halorussus gelatinilyticus]